MASHTAGSWFVTNDGPGYPQIHPEPEPAYCVGIAPCNINMPFDEVMANARLIAASPDLLKSLQDIVTYCECAPPGGDPTMLYELFHGAKAAIAKATGDDNGN